MKLRLFALFIFAAAAVPLVSGAAPPASDALGRPTSEPYKGDLGIFEGKERAQNLQVARVMDLLRLRPGSAVADIGAGGGWFTVRAARRVGPKGVVYAEEINPSYFQAIAARARKEKLPNVRPILGKPNDPRLPDGSVDAILLLKVYHEIAQPFEVLQHLRAALRPDGLLGIIDRNGTGADHGLDEKRVRQELQRAGFQFVAKYDFVKADGDDYFLILR